jgi:hypothetical protein
MLMRPIYRQGDVLLDRVDDLPAELKTALLAPQAGRVVLAYGEATGHFHSVSQDDAELFEVTTADRVDRYLRIRGATQLTHQEHAAIALEPGLYRVRIQSEYVPDPLSPISRRYVVD